MAPVQSVLLLTDGLVNKGISSKGRIIQEMMQIQDPECKSKVKCRQHMAE